jgi:hypothetical protein
MELVDLPIDLLVLLPQFLHNIEDFTNTSSSCRALRTVFANTSPNVILRLAAASSRVFFRPGPHFLVAATARQVSDWALLSNENTETLRQAFQGGIEALFELCISKAGLTLEHIRRLHASRFSLINPIADMIDHCAGQQWYATPDFWDGGVSDANTINVEPTRSLLQIIIYGELFCSSMRAALEPALGHPRFDLDTRLDFIKYCIPDWVCWLAYEGLEVRKVGPYASDDHKIIAQLEPDQVGLNHILRCRTWREAWEAVRRQIGPDFDEEWRQQMWHSAVQMQGLDGLEMLRPGGVEKWRRRLEEIRGKIEALGQASRPAVHKFGRHKNPASDAPSMADEVYVCMAGLWPS